MNDIKKAIESIQKEITEKENQIAILTSFENEQGELTEEKYHQLCETPLRGSRMLGKELEKIFPFLTLSDDKHYINDYVFTLEINNHSYKVLIPCSAIKNVSVIIPTPYLLNTEGLQAEEHEIEKIENKIETIENKMQIKSIFGRANWTMQGYRLPFRIPAYLIKYKTKKNYIAKLSKIKNDLQDSKERCKRNLEEQKINQQKYDETIKYFKDNFAPKFLEWTNEVVIKKYENDYGMNREYIKK